MTRTRHTFCTLAVHGFRLLDVQAFTEGVLGRN
jgi:hypothetical protein